MSQKPHFPSTPLQLLWSRQGAALATLASPLLKGELRGKNGQFSFVWPLIDVSFFDKIFTWQLISTEIFYLKDK